MVLISQYCHKVNSERQASVEATVFEILEASNMRASQLSPTNKATIHLLEISCVEYLQIRV